MVALSPTNKSRARFHLGYNAVIPAGDAARLENAMTQILDSYWESEIINQLSRCDAALKQTQIDKQDSGIQYKELMTGDINRSVVRYQSERLRVRQAQYIFETDLLSQYLGVPNYNNPTTYELRVYMEPGSYVNRVPGPADTSVGTKIYLHLNYA
jgi:hypothetical protein